MAIPDESLTGVDEFTARRVSSICERALVVAGVAGVLPTPLDEVAATAGVLQTLDMAQLPTEAEASKPNWLTRVIGAYAFKHRIVFVDRTQAPARARFTHAHETVHGILPWHDAVYTFDDETIFQETQIRLDAEANLGAGYLLFQGRRFTADALNYETRLASAIAMSERYAASAHATIRYFALHNAEDVGLLICGRFPLARGRSLPVWFTGESTRFRQKFGAMTTQVRTYGRNRYLDSTCEPLLTLALGALTSGSIVSDDATLNDLRGKSVRVWVDAWFNQFNVFVMVSPRPRIKRGQRVSVVSLDGTGSD